MRVLALDFDGVISDSAPESFAVAVRTYASFRPETTLSRAMAALAGARAPALERIRATPAYAPFLELMPLGNRAEDYAVVLAAIDAGRPIVDQARITQIGYRQIKHQHRALGDLLGSTEPKR